MSNKDRDTSTPGMWCNNCQCFHTSNSCFHPSAFKITRLNAEVVRLKRRIKELQAEVLHENDLFIEWRARAEGFETEAQDGFAQLAISQRELADAEATIERVKTLPHDSLCASVIGDECDCWKAAVQRMDR